MTFSERLRQLRQEKKMTQSTLGQAVDISPRMISFYESGNHFPRDEVILKRLAEHPADLRVIAQTYSDTELKIEEVIQSLPGDVL